MTTVKEFKDLGVEFVTGDSLKPKLQECVIIGCCIGVMDVSGDLNQDHEVVSFAWRPMSTLPENPRFKYERNRTNQESNTMWRPLLDQSQTETKEEREAFDKMKPYEFDAHVSSEKPVFTQAMANANKLPPVGNKILAVIDGEFVECELLKVRVNNAGMKVYAVMSAGFGLVWSGDIKPIDTRTPKQKAVDAAMEDIDAEADDVTKVVGVIERMIAAGYKKC